MAHKEREAIEDGSHSTSEFVAAAFNNTSLKKSVIIGFLYQSTGNNNCRELCRAMSELHSQHKANIILLGGVANLLDVNWTSRSIFGHQ